MPAKKGMQMRRDVMARSFRVRELFESGQVTSRMVADDLEISIQCARKWIDVASLFLPVYEIRMDGLTKVYGLLK
ncbi:unnamed protein product [marine sediment metagenome]|uniref:Helix-turn-helix type 11 domain-containing protein n=1 Tax=marine sediment metagenome TaxID=412755 RepID=X1RYQ2_9ZZZZ